MRKIKYCAFDLHNLFDRNLFNFSIFHSFSAFSPFEITGNPSFSNNFFTIRCSFWGLYHIIDFHKGNLSFWDTILRLFTITSPRTLACSRFKRQCTLLESSILQSNTIWFLPLLSVFSNKPELEVSPLFISCLSSGCVVKTENQIIWHQLLEEYFKLLSTWVAWISYFLIPRMLQIILSLPACENNMENIFFLFDIFNSIWQVTHVF